MSARKLRKRKDGVIIVSDSDAVWQYMLDHARYVQDTGFSLQMPIIKNREDFNKRLQARKDGLYRFTEEDLMKQKPIKKRKSRSEGIKKLLRIFLMRLLIALK